jgi:opine dehydrogenase
MATDRCVVATVVGTGLGGKAVAAQLALNGLQVRVHDLVEAQITGIRERGGIDVEGQREGFAPIELATTDLAAAVSGADLVTVVTVGNDHSAVARALAPHLVDGQIVLLIPGNTGGALVVRQALREAGCSGSVDVAEMDAFPLGMTVPGPSRVRFGTGKSSVQVAALPATRTASVLERLTTAFPQAVAGPSVLTTGLTHMNATMHVAGLVPNVGRIEALGRYEFYGEGITLSTAALVEAVDHERTAVAGALGAPSPSLRDWIESTYGVREPTLHETIVRLNREVYKSSLSPSTLDHR